MRIDYIWVQSTAQYCNYSKTTPIYYNHSVHLSNHTTRLDADRAGGGAGGVQWQECPLVIQYVIRH